MGMNETFRPAAVVAGASTGIGQAAAAALIAAGWRVFGSLRKESDAAAAKSELGEAFTPLIFDVTDGAAIARAPPEVRAALGGVTLKGLVNNAGVAVTGPLAYLPTERLQRQFEVNVFGPLRVAQAFLPLLGADRALKGAPGRIVNISSVAGRIALPFSGPYAMSKHALEAFSESLRRELIVHGVDVIVVGPGAIRTPIWSKSDESDIAPYLQTEYADILKRMVGLLDEVGAKGLPAEAAGAVIVEALTAARPKTRYALLSNRFADWTLPNLLPKRMVDRAVAKRFGMTARKAP